MSTSKDYKNGGFVHNCFSKLLKQIAF